MRSVRLAGALIGGALALCLACSQRAGPAHVDYAPEDVGGAGSIPTTVGDGIDATCKVLGVERVDPDSRALALLGHLGFQETHSVSVLRLQDESPVDAEVTVDLDSIEVVEVRQKLDPKASATNETADCRTRSMIRFVVVVTLSDTQVDDSFVLLGDSFADTSIEGMDARGVLASPDVMGNLATPDDGGVSLSVGLVDGNISTLEIRTIFPGSEASATDPFSWQSSLKYAR